MRIVIAEGKASGMRCQLDSPEDTMKRILFKLADYQQMGIERIFVVDPGRSCYFYEAGNLEIVEAPITGADCQIDFAAVAALAS